MAFIAPSKDLETQESISQGFVAPAADLEPSGFTAPAADLDSDDPGAADYAAAFAADIAISEAGRFGGAAAGKKRSAGEARLSPPARGGTTLGGASPPQAPPPGGACDSGVGFTLQSIEL